MFDVDVLKDPGDYTEMAQLAIEAAPRVRRSRSWRRACRRTSSPTQRTKDKNQRLLDAAKKRAAADQAALAKLEQEANAAATGDKNVGVGLAYLGYQQYDKAVDLLQKGAHQGRHEERAARTRLLLGIAQLKAGHKDDAVKTFKSVKGDPTLERLANLWVAAREVRPRRARQGV